MTSPPTKTLNHHANEIYFKITEAMSAGFRVEYDKYGHLDLVDKAGRREPLITATKKAED